MTSEEWVQVKEVFAELAASDTVVREARLHQLDGEVRDELEWLLANHDDAEENPGILNKPAIDSPMFLQWLGEAQVFASGQVLLERFEILRLIGRGGMGEVYEALDKQHPQLIAIKTIRLDLLSDAGIRERFRTEVQRSRQVSHENVCRVHELFSGMPTEDWHVPFFTMELLRGETLYERVRRCGPLPPEQARSVAHQICAGLDAAHRCGVVHRDLKSSNIILLADTDDDPQLQAKITDFGLARELPQEREPFITTTLPDGAGTLAYMAPELLEGKNANAASDVYALGVVLFRMVTARYPIEGVADVVSATMRLKRPAPSPRNYVPDLSRAWDRAILACLAADPKLRPSGALPVAQLLQDVPSALWSYRRRVVTRQLNRRSVLLGGVAVAGATVTRWWVRTEPPPFAGKQISVLVEDFESFDPGGALSRAVRNMLKVAYFRSEHVRVVRPDVMLEASKALNIGAVAVRGEPALRIARHTKADVVIRGNLQRSDSGFSLRLDALRSNNAERLLTIEDSAQDQQQLATAVERAAGNLQVGLTGGSLAAFQADGPRVEPADTLRRDALEMFTAGLEYFQYGDHSTALAHLELATKLDPHFAMAYVYQAIAHSSLRREDLAFPPLLHAYELRNRVNERQRLHTEALYHDRSGDFSKALDQYRALIAMYPNESQPHRHIAQLYSQADMVADAERHARTAVELNPRSASNYMILAAILAQGGKSEEAFSTIGRGRQQAPNSPLFLSSEGVVRTISGDVSGALAQFRELEKKPGLASLARSHMIRCLLVYGPLNEARTRVEGDVSVNEATNEHFQADLCRYWLAGLLNLNEEYESAAEIARLLTSRSAEPYNLFTFRAAAEIAHEARALPVVASAVEKIHHINRSYPSSRCFAILLHVQALQSASAGRLGEAKRVLGQAHGILADIPNTWALGQICTARGEFIEALPLYESVMRRWGGAIRFHNQIQLVRSHAEAAKCFQALGRFREAVEACDLFLRLWGTQSNFRLVKQIRSVQAESARKTRGERV